MHSIQTVMANPNHSDTTNRASQGDREFMTPPFGGHYAIMYVISIVDVKKQSEKNALLGVDDDRLRLRPNAASPSAAPRANSHFPVSEGCPHRIALGKFPLDPGHLDRLP